METDLLVDESVEAVEEGVLGGGLGRVEERAQDVGLLVRVWEGE